MKADSHKALVGLHQAYVKGLPQRIALLEVHWNDICHSPFDTIALQKYYRDVHDLSGSSGTHGYMPLSKSLRQLDKILNDALKKNTIEDTLKHAPALLTEIKLHATIPPNPPELFK